VQVSAGVPDVELHPAHEVKVLPFAEVAGAVSVTVVFGGAYASESGVAPVPFPFTSLGLTVILTPLPGFELATVMAYDTVTEAVFVPLP
jgi:hypothetical protein